MDLVKQILENHTRLSTTTRIYNVDENIEITVNQQQEKIAMWAFNNKTDRKVNLSTKNYTKLIDGFKEISTDIYLTNEGYHITLDQAVAKKQQARYFGYCRVSTNGQLDNNSLEQQEQEILNKYSNSRIIKEVFTGTKTDRPKFNELMNNLNEGDTLIVTKLDRLARNTVEGIKIVEELFAKGVSVHVLNVGLLENTSMGKFFLTTLLAVAEMERNTIIERTQAGKEISKQKDGFKDGRPNKFNNKQIQHALKLLEINSYKEVEQITGISKSTLIRAKKKLNQED
jgi:DNA invertase Pin-like site-specific DNA recombinase